MAISSDPRADPFTEFLLPPLEETDQEKALRERKEMEARRISEAIDDDIKLERSALKKERNVVKALLLGQSESGKSHLFPMHSTRSHGVSLHQGSLRR
jgi:guanine nucleotide-binding protein subunit alpha